MYFHKNYFKSAKKTIFNGTKYDSKFEAGYAMELEARKRSGEILSYDSHCVYPLVVNGYRICNYSIDFVVYHANGITEYVECKGYPHPLGILKFHVFEALFSDNPDTVITFVSQGKYKPRKLKKVKIC